MNDSNSCAKWNFLLLQLSPNPPPKPFIKLCTVWMATRRSANYDPSQKILRICWRKLKLDPRHQKFSGWDLPTYIEFPWDVCFLMGFAITCLLSALSFVYVLMKTRGTFSNHSDIFDYSSFLIFPLWLRLYRRKKNTRFLGPIHFHFSPSLLLFFFFLICSPACSVKWGAKLQNGVLKGSRCKKEGILVPVKLRMVEKVMNAVFLGPKRSTRVDFHSFVCEFRDSKRGMHFWNIGRKVSFFSSSFISVKIYFQLKDV